MKILIVTDAWHPQVNGVVRTYEYLRAELEDMGHTVKIIGPPDFPKSYPMPGYDEIRLVMFPYAELSKMISADTPDLLHIATEGPLGLAARKYATHNGIAFTSCYHTHFPDYAAKRAAKYLPFLYDPVRNAGIAFMRWFHAPSSCLLVATQSLEHQLRSWNFSCPIRPMTHGIDHTLFKLGDKTLFKEMKKPIALYVGRVAIEKNLENFLKMNWNGSKVIVGDGPDLEKLKSKYTDTVFAGIQTGQKLADHFRSADIFVFPSKTDTFGMVLVEAMACGLPLAGYPFTGPVDIIDHDFLGAVDDDLSTAANRALKTGTPEQRSANAVSRYSWRKAAEQFLDVC